MTQNNVLLSIVTPTLGKFSDYWLQQLLAIEGDTNTVEFILVYPPLSNNVSNHIDDPRVKTLVSMFKGETAQRFTGLINASGKYVIALDDDDYLHPKVAGLVAQYFNIFPESMVLRLAKKVYDYRDKNAKKPWDDIPLLEKLEAETSNTHEQATEILKPLIIAPLKNKFRLIFLVWPYTKRKDHHGSHMENFNNRAWLTSAVKESLADLSATMRLADPLTWIPSWGFDRLLCLYIQAKYFDKYDYIGHQVLGSEQVRYIGMPSGLKSIRLIFSSDSLLAIRFPQYGYFWNLFFEELYNTIKTKIKQFLGILKSS